MVPGIGQRAENNNVVGRRTRVRTSLVIIRIAIRAWASMFEILRKHRRATRVGRSKGPTATKLRIAEGLARAPARHAPSLALTRDPQCLWARAVQVHQATRGAASASSTSPGHHQHREVVTVDQADVIEVQAVGAVESELG